MMLLGGLPFSFVGFLKYLYVQQRISGGKKIMFKLCPLCSALGSLHDL